MYVNVFRGSVGVVLLRRIIRPCAPCLHIRHKGTREMYVHVTYLNYIMHRRSGSHVLRSLVSMVAHIMLHTLRGGGKEHGSQSMRVTMARHIKNAHSAEVPSRCTPTGPVAAHIYAGDQPGLRRAVASIPFRLGHLHRQGLHLRLCRRTNTTW